jgi:NAD-dependent SIR2 family protein deacetylase
MSKAADLREIPELPDEIVQAGLNGELVLFVGAGISILLGLPSWGGLARKALHTLLKNGFLNFSELEQLKNLDPKKQLSIAKLIAEENEHELDLTGHFEEKVEANNIYQSINDIGCACVTTNYDELLAPRFHEAKDDLIKSISIKPKDVIRISDKNDFLAKHLDEPGTVVHLHGAISKPETMVVTTKAYLEHYDHENVQNFLSELFAKKIVLFIGYGLEESEILEHILRRGAVESTKDRRRFALQGYFRSQEPLYKNLYQYYEKSFGVHLIGFVRDHKDYAQQENIMKSWVPQIQVKKSTLYADLVLMNEVLGSD